MWLPVLLSALSASPALGEDDFRRTSILDEVGSSTVGLALITSGAVSLGAYQAGFLYFTGNRSKRVGLPAPKLVTGSSAGAANSLIAAVEGCQPPNDDPTSSLGWRVWIPVGLDALWRPEEASPTGLLSSREMRRAFGVVSSVLEQGLPSQCDFVLGITATRLDPLQVALTEGLSVPRQEEKFAVRVQGQGLGVPSRVSNYIDPYRDVPQPLLQFGTGFESADYEVLSTALFASASFPMAFTPTEIAHCLTKPPGNAGFIPELPLECAGPVRRDPFVDGGILDNSPLRLAYELAQRGLRTDRRGRPVWRDLTRSVILEPRPEFDRLIFAYIDPWTRAYPDLPEEVEAERSGELDTMRYSLGLLAQLAASARRKELYTLAESRDRIQGRLILSRAHFPAAGDLFYAFFGFFERDFRIFDFYLGMYDAYLGTRRIALPVAHEPWRTNADGNIPRAWRPFVCLLSWFEPGHEAQRDACQGPELANFRILIQLALERLHDHCRRLPAGALDGFPPHPRCAEAMQGKASPRLVEDGGGAPSSLASTFEILDRLADLGFEFKDLGLSKDRSSEIRTRLRRRFAEMADRLDAVQPPEGLRILGRIGRAAANTLRYESPPWMVPILVGGRAIEAGLLTSPFDGARDVLRLGLSLQLRNWSTLILPGQPYPGLAATVGVELMSPPLTGAVLQPVLGVRGGYQLGSFDGFGGSECRANESIADSRACSQVLLQTYLALGLLDLLRLQLTLDVFPERGFGDGLAEQNFDLDLAWGVTLF